MPHREKQLAQYMSWGQFEAMPKDDQPPMTFDEAHIPDAFLVGSPSSLADQISRYVETIGANHFVVKNQWAGMEHRDVLRSIDLIGNQLSPLL